MKYQVHKLSDGLAHVHTHKHGQPKNIIPPWPFTFWPQNPVSSSWSPSAPQF